MLLLNYSDQNSSPDSSNSIVLWVTLYLLGFNVQWLKNVLLFTLKRKDGINRKKSGRSSLPFYPTVESGNAQWGISGGGVSNIKFTP